MFTGLMAYLSFTNFDFVSLVPVGCMVTVTYHYLLPCRLHGWIARSGRGSVNWLLGVRKGDEVGEEGGFARNFLQLFFNVSERSELVTTSAW